MGDVKRSSGMVSWGVHSSDPIYYTTSTICKDVDDFGSHGEELQFQETRTTPILPNPNTYECSVESAVINTKALPSFIAPVDETQSDPDLLAPLVGLQLEWNGSLFPVDELVNASSNPNSSPATQNLTYAISSSGSSFPIRYYRRGKRNTSSATSNYTILLKTGTSSTTFTVENIPSVNGVLEVLRQNNPNSCEWTGSYIYNVSVDVLTASFNRALQRAYGLWIPISLFSPATTVTLTAYSTAPYSSGDFMSVNTNLDNTYLPLVTSGSQVLITNAYNATLDANFLSMLNGYYIVEARQNSGGMQLVFRVTPGIASWIKTNKNGLAGKTLTCDISFIYGTSGPLVPGGAGTGAAATGGVITTSGSYTYHTFTTNGSFTPLSSSSLAISYLVVGGGGAG